MLNTDAVKGHGVPIGHQIGVLIVISPRLRIRAMFTVIQPRVNDIVDVMRNWIGCIKVAFGFFAFFRRDQILHEFFSRRYVSGVFVIVFFGGTVARTAIRKAVQTLSGCNKKSS